MLVLVLAGGALSGWTGMGTGTGEVGGSAGCCGRPWALAGLMGWVLVVRVRQLALLLCRGYVGLESSVLAFATGRFWLNGDGDGSSKGAGASLPAAPSFPCQMHAGTGYGRDICT